MVLKHVRLGACVWVLSVLMKFDYLFLFLSCNNVFCQTNQKWGKMSAPCSSFDFATFSGILWWFWVNLDFFSSHSYFGMISSGCWAAEIIISIISKLLADFSTILSERYSEHCFTTYKELFCDGSVRSCNAETCIYTEISEIVCL